MRVQIISRAAHPALTVVVESLGIRAAGTIHRRISFVIFICTCVLQSACAIDPDNRALSNGAQRRCHYASPPRKSGGAARAAPTDGPRKSGRINSL